MVNCVSVMRHSMVHAKTAFAVFDGPILVCSFLALLVIAKVPRLRRLFRGAPSRCQQPSLPSLRRAVLGHGTRSIIQMLGSPRAATQGVHPVWYYPVNTRERLAMAIWFDKGHATAVEFFSPPG